MRANSNRGKVWAPHTTSTGDAIIITDGSGRVTFINKRATELTGRDAGAGLEQTLADIYSTVDGGSGAPLPDPFMRIASNGSTEHAAERLLLRSDGACLAVEENASPIRTAQGTLLGVVVCFRESQPQRDGEPEPQAQQSNDDFFASLAHELRNPLAPIRNALQIMQVVQDDGATTSAARVIIERQLKHLTRLIDDLLDMSRMAQGTFELSKTRCALADVIHQALDIARPQLEGKQHPLQIELGCEEVYLSADSNRLAQALANLLHNASKYSSAGTPIRVVASGTQQEIIIRVIDQGVGIPADMFEHVFDLYGQVNRLEDATHDGLGIGLTLVKRIIELHGGTVTAASPGAGHGSEFTVHLPRQADSGADIIAPASLHPAAMQRLRILVADDNRDAAHTLAMLLRLDGHEVRAVHDGVEALAAGDGFAPQLVLLDIGMPLLDGYETARQIQKRPWGEQAHLVALTGWGLDADRRRAMAAGFHEHLVKPVEPEALKAVIERLVAE